MDRLIEADSRRKLQFTISQRHENPSLWNNAPSTRTEQDRHMDALNTSVKLPEPFSVTSDPFGLTRSHAELILCEAEPRLWCAATEQVDGPLDCSGQQAVDCGTEQPNARENFFLSEQNHPLPPGSARTPEETSF